ncbi:MAG TPA: hypothetical protein VFG23_08425 [Polyangia bacterium]|nr:hypothetical protein [Polyangia bacterium]
MTPVAQEDELWQVSADGELVGRMPSLTEALERIVTLQGQLADIERERRGERARVRNLMAQIHNDRGTYERRAEVEEITREWRGVCGHPKARLTDDRFDAVRALLEVTKPEPYSRESFSLAFAGAAHDPYVTTRKNGSRQKHDDLALVCRDGKTFEEFQKRAPRHVDD